jgi:hypothetical protein
VNTIETFIRGKMLVVVCLKINHTLAPGSRASAFYYPFLCAAEIMLVAGLRALLCFSLDARTSGTGGSFDC